ncbi:DUF1803 domain-containing protein [Vagococcus vulneris]|uniref:DUF1803 domain-containing protein n=1 Tax=Vagococcus vulneris TaxID=1977869 RepID=A0A430A2D2_9ENTE|nr:DUF1803 domain-containing protein [Vagococcus vulneris]RSU00572.1 hypothetical protein CBF37_00735 [Vagococcus vulneris]
MLKMDILKEDSVLAEYGETDFPKELLDFLVSHRDDTVTLRDIKRYFPSMSNIERHIDVLIKNGLLQRYHGRYMTDIPYIKTNELEESCQEIIKSVNNQKKKFLAWFDKEKLKSDDDQFVLAELLSLFVKTPSKNKVVLFETNEFIQRWEKYPNQLSTRDGILYKWDVFHQPVISERYDLNDYFNHLSINEEQIPSKYQKIYQKIGDVNPEFYFSYIDRKIRRLLKGKNKISNHPDILMTSLVDLDYLIAEKDYYQMMVVYLPEKTSKECPVWYDCIKEDLLRTLDYETIGDFLLINCLLDQLVIERSIDINKTIPVIRNKS